MEDSAQKKIPRPATLKLPNKALRYVSLFPATSEEKFMKNLLILVAVQPINLQYATFNVLQNYQTRGDNKTATIRSHQTENLPNLSLLFSRPFYFSLCSEVSERG